MKTLLLTAAALLSTQPLFAQGAFPPPSAPNVPIMKTLTQVEPRTPIPSGTLATTYTITQPGSYYLTGNITTTIDIHAIVVSNGVNDVTIDLNGYTIESTYASPGVCTAILMVDASRIRIRNGIIKSGSDVTAGVITKKGFARGIYASSFLKSTHISGVQVVGVGEYAILSDSDSLVEDCQVSHCGSGIYNSNGGTTRHSIVTNCANSGILSTLVESCQGSGYSGSGISAKTIINSIGTSNSDYGLFASSNATNCSGTSTSSTGLYATNAANCTGTSTSNLGIYATTATNCTGTTYSSSAGKMGLYVIGTANTCQGVAGGPAATAIHAAIAIGCTYSGGILDVPVGKQFNM